MKRFLSFLLCFAVLLPQTAFASFSDTDNSPYETSINWMYRNQAVEGYRSGEFQPDSCTTRAEFLIMLYKMLEIDYYRAELDFPDAEMMEFSDVNPGDWYYPVVKRGVLSGAVEGYADGSFQPNWCITRSEAVKIAVLEFNDGMVPEPYFDVYMEDLDPNEWYYEFVNYALSTDEVGTDHAALNENYGPGEEMSREEVAEMLYRMKTVRDHKLNYYSDRYEPFPLESEIFFNNCNAGYYSDNDRISVQSAIPYNSDIVLGVNYAHNEEVKNLNHLLDSYVSDDMWNSLIESYNSMDMPNSLTYEASVEPFITDDWNLALSLVFPEDVEDIFSVNEEDMEIYFMGSFKQYEDFENFFGRWLQISEGDAISCERNGDFVYWTAEADDLYIAHKDGFFVATNSAENREKAVERADNDEEFAYGTDVETLYGFVSADVIGPFMEAMESEMSWQLGTSIGIDPNDFGDLSFTADAEADGIRIQTSIELAEDSDLASLYDGNVSLIDRVNGENLIAYMETQDFLTLANLELEPLGTDLYSWIADTVVTETETDETAQSVAIISEDSFNSLLDAPFALALNGKELIPGLSLYLDFTGQDSADSSDFQTTVRLLMDTLLAPSGDDTEWSDQDGIDLWTLVLDSETNLEIRSGMLDEATYVLSIDPSVVTSYGGTSVAENSDYMDLVSQLDHVGSSLVYWNPSELVSWVEGSELADFLDYMTTDEAMVWELIGNLGAGASTSWMEDGVVHSEMFVGIR